MYNPIFVLATDGAQYASFYNAELHRAAPRTDRFRPIYNADSARGWSAAELIVLPGVLEAKNVFGEYRLSDDDLLSAIYPALDLSDRHSLGLAAYARSERGISMGYKVDFGRYKIFEDRTSVILPGNILLLVNRCNDKFYYVVKDTTDGEILDSDEFSLCEVHQLGVEPFSVCIAEVLGETIMEWILIAKIEKEIEAQIALAQKEVDEEIAAEEALEAENLFESRIDDWLSQVREMLVDDMSDYRLMFDSELDHKGPKAMILGICSDMPALRDSEMMERFISTPKL